MAATDARLGVLAGCTVKSRLLDDRERNVVWFFDEIGELHVYDGYSVVPMVLEVAGVEGRTYGLRDDVATLIDGQTLVDERVTFADAKVSATRDVIRIGSRLLVFDGRGHGVALVGLRFASYSAARDAVARLVANPPEGMSRIDSWYREGIGAIRREYHVPLPGGATGKAELALLGGTIDGRRDDGAPPLHPSARTPTPRPRSRRCRRGRASCSRRAAGSSSCGSTRRRHLPRRARSAPARRRRASVSSTRPTAPYDGVVEPIAVHIAVLAIAKVPDQADLAGVSAVVARAVAAGHRIATLELVEDTELAIRNQLELLIANPELDVVIAIGTADSQAASAALRPLVSETLPGFTDLFRLLAFQEIGASAMLSNAEAARCGSTFVFVLPASIGAAGNAMEKLILPQLDSRTTPRNLVSQMPRLQPAEAVPQEVVNEKTEAGVGLPRRLPAKRTGKNVVDRKPAPADDKIVTKPIALERLQRELDASGENEAPTRPHIDLAKLLPRVPPGADDLDEVGDITDVTEPAPERSPRAASNPAEPPMPALLAKLELKSIPAIPPRPRTVEAKPTKTRDDARDSHGAKAPARVTPNPRPTPVPSLIKPTPSPSADPAPSPNPPSPKPSSPTTAEATASRDDATQASDASRATSKETDASAPAATSDHERARPSTEDAKPDLTDESPTPPARKRPRTQPPPPPAKRAPTAPPPPIATSKRPPTQPPPVLAKRTGDDLPRGTFNYPVHRPRTAKRIVGLLGLAVLAAAAGVAFVHFVFDRDHTEARTAEPTTPPPAPAPSPPPATTPPAVAVATPDAAPEIEIDVPDPAPPPTPPSETPTPKPTPTRSKPKPAKLPKPPTTAHPPGPAVAAAPVDAARPPADPTAVATAPAVPDGCDEVSCVLDKYARPCCEHFRPNEGAGHVGPPDTLDRLMVRAGVETVKARVIACGEKIAAKGTVKITMKVGADGKVREVSVVDAPVPALGDCVAAALRAAKFGKSVNGVSFTYPFVF